MNSNWFFRMLNAMDEAIDLSLVIAIVLILVLFCCMLTQMNGVENVKSLLLPISSR